MFALEEGLGLRIYRVYGLGLRGLYIALRTSRICRVLGCM